MRVSGVHVFVRMASHARGSVVQPYTCSHTPTPMHTCASITYHAPFRAAEVVFIPYVRIETETAKHAQHFAATAPVPQYCTY